MDSMLQAAIDQMGRSVVGLLINHGGFMITLTIDRDKRCWVAEGSADVPDADDNPTTPVYEEGETVIEALDRCADELQRLEADL
jgi:hypothetical protein